MTNPKAIEVLLRPAVELYSATACLCAACLCLVAPWSLALSRTLATASAFVFLGFGALRFRDAFTVLNYRRHIRRLPRYEISSHKVPVSGTRLFVGRGFKWDERHTHRLMQTYRPEFRPYVEQGRLFRAARRAQEKLEFTPLLSPISRLLGWDSALNPVRPLPPGGGLARLHGVEPHERDVSIALSERVGHLLVMGTTRVGKTRLGEFLITQDIHRIGADGEFEVVIVFDPKGDAELLQRIAIETRRAGREDAFYVFHLGWPDISSRYNAVGRFSRISEVATRLASQLSMAGDSAAFREFAWRFVNIVSRALVELGQRPDYSLILRHVINIDALYIEYAQHYFARHDPKAWGVIVQMEARQQQAEARGAGARDPRLKAISDYVRERRIYDPVLDGLWSAVRYDRTYYDKIVASLLPLLEKLTTGKVAQLLAPNYSDLLDPRPIFDWMQVIRKRAVVYVGLDALSDADVAKAVGNSMFADLVSVAGHLYKFGADDGLPGGEPGRKHAVNLHCDEFNELMGDEFIPLVNKGGGAGIQVTAYTQTLSDIEARIGNRAKAGQVIGNFNNLIMLRVRETTTAELLTRQLPKVDVFTAATVAGATDTSDPHSGTAFTSNIQDRVSAQQVPLIEPAHVIALPKGQAFALLDGGQLYKLRLPLIKPESDEGISSDVKALIEHIRRRACDDETPWWNPPARAPEGEIPVDLEEVA